MNAATGTGKTIAYLAPIIHHLQGKQPRIQRSDGTFGTFLCLSLLGQLYSHHSLILQCMLNC